MIKGAAINVTMAAKTYDVYLIVSPKLSPRIGFSSVSKTENSQVTEKNAQTR